MNPLKNQPYQNNPINSMLQFMNSGGNPQQLAQQILQQNPGVQQAFTRLQQVAAGKNPKDIAMQLAQERGLDPAQLMQVAKRMGLK